MNSNLTELFSLCVTIMHVEYHYYAYKMSLFKKIFDFKQYYFIYTIKIVYMYNSDNNNT